MNIEKVKSIVSDLKGQEVFIKVNVGRNKYEHFEGKIENVYNNLFTVRVDNLVKSFTFSDVLTKDVQLKTR